MAARGHPLGFCSMAASEAASSLPVRRIYLSCWIVPSPRLGLFSLCVGVGATGVRVYFPSLSFCLFFISKQYQRLICSYTKSLPFLSWKL